MTETLGNDYSVRMLICVAAPFVRCKMGIPGPHFPSRIGTRDPHFPRENGDPLVN